MTIKKPTKLRMPGRLFENRSGEMGSGGCGPSTIGEPSTCILLEVWSCGAALYFVTKTQAQSEECCFYPQKLWHETTRVWHKKNNRGASKA